MFSFGVIIGLLPLIFIVTSKGNKFKYVFAPGTLGILADTYLVPVSHIMG